MNKQRNRKKGEEGDGEGGGGRGERGKWRKKWVIIENNNHRLQARGGGLLEKRI